MKSSYKVTRLVTINELPTTEVLAETATLEEAKELKNFFEESYRNEIISIEEYIEQEEGRCNEGMILTAVANLSAKKMIYINKIYHPKKEEENV